MAPIKVFIMQIRSTALQANNPSSDWRRWPTGLLAEPMSIPSPEGRRFPAGLLAEPMKYSFARREKVARQLDGGTDEGFPRPTRDVASQPCRQ